MPKGNRWTEAEVAASFDRTGNSPDAWRQKATSLLRAADALEAAWNSCIAYDPPDPPEALDYIDPALMLRAMAFECLLKARALENGLVLARGGRYLRVRGLKHSHDLVSLAHVAQVSLTPVETRVLNALTTKITQGRYPIQQNWTHQARIRADGLLEFLHVGWFPDWDEPCRALLQRLHPQFGEPDPPVDPAQIEAWLGSMARRDGE